MPYISEMCVVVIVALLAASLWTLATGKCPPINSGLIDLLRMQLRLSIFISPGKIYLMYGGYCLPEYTVISDFALTADNPLHCVLAGGTGGGGGQWTGPDNTSVRAVQWRVWSIHLLKLIRPH